MAGESEPSCASAKRSSPRPRRTLRAISDEVELRVQTAYNKMERTRQMVAVSEELLALRAESRRVVAELLTNGGALGSQAKESNAQELEAQAALLQSQLDYVQAADEMDAAIGRRPRRIDRRRQADRAMHSLPGKHGPLGPPVARQSGSHWISRHHVRYSGLGLSTGEKNYDPESLARDAHDLIEALGLQGVVIGGWSLGGLAAQAFVAIYPQHVTHAVLIGTGPPGLNVKNAEQLFYDRRRGL